MHAAFQLISMKKETWVSELELGLDLCLERSSTGLESGLEWSSTGLGSVLSSLALV